MRRVGRPRVAPALASVRTQQRRAQDARNCLDARYEQLGADYGALTRLFLKKTKEHVGTNAKKLIKQYAHNENIAKEAVRVLKNPPRKLTGEDALQVLLRVDLSKHQYLLLREIVNDAANHKNLIPSYTIVAAQKAIAMPRNPPENYSEMKAQVSLQDLLDHTTRRAVLCNEDIIKTNYEDSEGTINCVFTITYGGDGAGNQQLYQQKHQIEANVGKKDESLFAAVINPLKLESEAGELLWENEVPQSHLYVRPFLLEYEKETKDYVTRTFDNINEQIDNLAPVEIALSPSVKLVIRFKMICSLIDGKVFCHLVNVATTACPICGVNHAALTQYSQHLNDMDALPDRLRFSVQSCHARINMASMLIRMDCKRAADQAKREAKDEDPDIDDDELRQIGIDAGKARKKDILEEFKQDDLHLTDMITGNMARLMLGPRKDLTARILNIDLRIIERFEIICICINTTQYKVKVAPFKRYCAQTRNLFLQLYPWYTITPTLHKVLEHSADSQVELDLCMGVVSEGGAENQHRIRKLIRRFRARKTSRKENLTDVLNRCLHLSDPLLSTKYSSETEKYRIARRKKPVNEFPEKARRLLDFRPRPRRLLQPRWVTERRIVPEQQLVVDSDTEEEEDMEIDEAEGDNEPLDADFGSSDEGEWIGDDFHDE